MRVLKPRDNPKTGPAGAPGDVVAPGIEQAAVAAEFVDGKSPYHRAIRRVQYGLRAYNLRNHAATINVAHQDDRHACLRRKAHIGDIARAQVRLCGATGTFDDDQIASAGKPVERLQHGRHQAGLVFAERRRFLMARDLALHNHLRPGRGLWFQQNGIHIGMRCNAGGQRLQGLCAPDLAAILCHGGIVGHVLRFEGSHSYPAFDAGADQSCNNHRLAHIAACALDHNGFCHAVPLAFCGAKWRNSGAGKRGKR